MSISPRGLPPYGVATALLLIAPILGATVLAAEPSVVVQPGDTLSELALEHGVGVEQLVAMNALADPDRIYVGQRLILAPDTEGIPAAAPTAANPTAPSTVHTVVSGENLTWIARRHGSTVEAIVAANAIANPRLIYAGQQLSIPGAQAPASSVSLLSPEREAVRQMLVEEATRQGVPSPFVLAVAWHESGWRQGALSSAGAVGVMQLLPATGQWVGDVMLGQPVDIHDVRSNIRAGVRLLAHYLNRYGSRELALAAYYQGQAGTDRHGVYPGSRAYVNSILHLEIAFGG
jgi:N-acetylmuramoyl-L-alanine amidase